MTTLTMWRASALKRIEKITMSPALSAIVLAHFASHRNVMARMERVTSAISLLNSPDFVSRSIENQTIGLHMATLISNTVDGPSAALFRDAHTHTIRSIVKGFCPETETRVIHLSHAISAASRINTHIQDIVSGLVGRLLEQIKREAGSVWYTEREIATICGALSKFATQCYRDFVLSYKDRGLYLEILSLLERRYGDRSAVTELLASSFVLIPIEDQIRVAIAGRQYRNRARSLVLGCFCKSYAHTRYPSDDEIDGFALLVPHICAPEIISVSHAHMTNSFAYSLGTYINALQSKGRDSDVENVLKFAKLLWDHVPHSRNTKDRSYATRLALLSGVPWLRPSTEELKKAIAPLRYTYAFNVLPALRGLRVVASLDNAPRSELCDVIEQVVCDNLHLIKLTDVKFVLRQLADPRVPVSGKVVEKLVVYLQGAANFNADDLSMIARLVSNHAPQELHHILLKEISRQFTACAPNSSSSALSLVTVYEITIRNNLESKGFYERGSEFNRLVAERIRTSSATVNYSDLQNFLHFAPIVLDFVRPSMMRLRDVREFAQSLIDLGCVFVLGEKIITPSVARRILHFVASIAVCGTPGRNVNAVIRPILQHLMANHVVTPETISGFTRSVSQAFRKCSTTQEMKRMSPVLNLYCTVLLRNQFLVPPITATYAIGLLMKRGSVTVEPVNRSHQEVIRICANILAREEHREQVRAVIVSGANNMWLCELLGNAHLLDFEARKFLFEAVTEFGAEKVFDTRAHNSLLWSISKGEFLYVS